MKKAVCVVAAAILLPSAGHAQEINPLPGLYVGAGGGLAWFLNTSSSAGGSISSSTGWAVGGLVGYDFVGPRIELEVAYGQVPITASLPIANFNGTAGQLQIMGKVLYDFFPASAFTPYVGAGAGIGFVDSNTALGSTVFAYQGILGLGWNIDSQWRIALEGRYVGTTNPNVTVNGVNVTYNNNNFAAIMGVQYKFAPPAAAARRRRLPPSHRLPSWCSSIGTARACRRPRLECHQAGVRACLEQGQRAHHSDGPHGYVGLGAVQHGAVTPPRQLP